MPVRTRSLLLSLALLTVTWSSTAVAVPVLEVTASSNPIIGGVVQLMPGDSNVSISFGIVPMDGVTSFQAFFQTTSAEIAVGDCTGVLTISLALCPPPLGTDDLTYSAIGDEGTFDPALTDPFGIGTATISVGSSAAPGDALQASIGSFIEEGIAIEFISGQVVATVVPEPGTALLLGLGVVGMGVRRRAIA